MYSTTNFKKGEVYTDYIVTRVSDEPRVYQDKFLWTVELSRMDKLYVAEEVTIARTSALKDYLMKTAPIVCTNPGHGTPDRPAWIKLDEPMKSQTGIDRDMLFVARDSMRIATDLYLAGGGNYADDPITHIASMAGKIAKETINLAKSL